MSSLSCPLLILTLKPFSSIYQIPPNNLNLAYLLHPTKTPNDLTYPSNSLAVSVEQSQPLPCTVPDNQTTFVVIGTLCLLGKSPIFCLPCPKQKLASFEATLVWNYNALTQRVIDRRGWSVELQLQAWQKDRFSFFSTNEKCCLITLRLT